MQDPAASRARRVLVVDDEPLGRKLVGLQLKHAGFAVETAGTGEEALRMATSIPLDAILSDLRMPGMDGLALCEAVRRDTRAARILFLLLSSDVLDEPELSRAAQLGITGVFLRAPDLRGPLDALAKAFPPPSPEGE